MEGMPMMDVAPADEVVIRSIREEDLLGLEWEGEYRHYRRVYRQTFDEARAGQRVMLVAALGPHIVGQIFVQLASAERQYADGLQRGYLYSLRVRPAWRRRGLGTRLVQAAEAELRARGFCTAVIAVGKDNAGALRLYERLDYHVFRDDPGVWHFIDVNGQPQHVAEPCWVMEKRLEAGS